MDGRGGVLAYRDDGQDRASGAPSSPKVPWFPEGFRRSRGIRWLPALAYGLGVAMLSGVGWGLVAVASGYIFCLGAMIIGVTVAWAVRKGAGQVTAGVIVLAAVLTELSVFFGDIVALSIIGRGFLLTVVDVIASYPAFVAQTPGETLVAYVFGLAGVGVASQYLWG